MGPVAGLRWVLPLALLLAVVPPCAGKVFMRWRGARFADRICERVDGRRAYSAAVRVNGAPGQVDVIHCPRGLDETLARLRAEKQANPRSVMFGTGDMAFGVFYGDGRAVRWLAIGAPRGATKALLFVLDQSEEDFARSVRPPAGERLPGLPLFAGAEAEFLIRNEDTSTSLLVARTGAAGEDVQRFYASSLSSDGWMEPLPPREGSPSPLARVYQKGNAICCVGVSGPDRDGTSRITLLHKVLSVR
jgi:hypothetical protein